MVRPVAEKEKPLTAGGRSILISLPSNGNTINLSSLMKAAL
jgi:hypothetical protein